jgi:hypothetical protein
MVVKADGAAERMFNVVLFSSSKSSAFVWLAGWTDDGVVVYSLSDRGLTSSSWRLRNAHAAPPVPALPSFLGMKLSV